MQERRDGVRKGHGVFRQVRGERDKRGNLSPTVTDLHRQCSRPMTKPVLCDGPCPPHVRVDAPLPQLP